MVRNVNVGERISMDEDDIDDSQVKIVMDADDAEMLQKLIIQKEMEKLGLTDNLHLIKF